MELFNKDHKWNSINTLLEYEWFIRDVKAYTKYFNESEWVVYNFICIDRPEVDKIELSVIMDWIKTQFRFMNMDYNKQKEFAKGILIAEKLEKGFDVSGIDTIFNLRNPELKRKQKQLIIDHYKPIRKQLHSEYIVNDGKSMPKNYFIKCMTTDLYNTIRKKYNLGTAKTKCVIGEIYSCYGIGLTEPILTREQFEKNKHIHTNYNNYKSYLIGTLKSYLIKS